MKTDFILHFADYKGCIYHVFLLKHRFYHLMRNKDIFLNFLSVIAQTHNIAVIFKLNNSSSNNKK